MRELAWVKALPHITHWHGFSPGDARQEPGQDISTSLPSTSPCRPREAHPPTRVNANVPLQGAGVSELPLAVNAHVRFLPAVDPQVPLQVPCGETKGRPGRGLGGGARGGAPWGGGRGESRWGGGQPGPT